MTILSGIAAAVIVQTASFAGIGAEGAAVPEPVQVAMEALRRDMTDVTLVTEDGSAVEISIACDPSVGGFEAHRVHVEGNTVHLDGADTRGVIYAIYTFSERVLGVPALWYFCGWKSEPRRIAVPSDLDIRHGSPQVRYRAWFPNDQDLFVPWRRLSRENDEMWLETMLRLKLNTVELEATVTYPNYKMNRDAGLLRKYGLVLTSHHMVGLNNSFGNWEGYWEKVKGVKAPQLSVNDLEALKEFWNYNIQTVIRNNQENLWQIAFRGRRDEPFWAAFADAPQSDRERAEVINRMVAIQYEMIREATGEKDPFVRMTFYDELSDLLAKGWLKPPAHSNMLWTFVAGRRDHYPYDDIVNFDRSRQVKLGYYMNLQFTSTGAHLAAAESPWKMEQNYRYVNSVAPLTFSVVNAGNLREFMMELSANAAMMWDFDSYDSDKFLHEFCSTYYGNEFADAAAVLYREYYYDYWNQKPSEFPGMDRQFIFHDMRYARVFNQISARFAEYDPNPLKEIGFERIKGRSFRIEGASQVDSLLAASGVCVRKFAATARRCEALMAQLPEAKRPFFEDNLLAPCRYMEHLNLAMEAFLTAYKGEGDRDVLLRHCEHEVLAARDALRGTHRGVFAQWYDSEHLFGFEKILEDLRKLL